MLLVFVAVSTNLIFTSTANLCCLWMEHSFLPLYYLVPVPTVMQCREQDSMVHLREALHLISTRSRKICFLKYRSHSSWDCRTNRYQSVLLVENMLSTQRNVYISVSILINFIICLVFFIIVYYSSNIGENLCTIKREISSLKVVRCL